MNQEKTNTPQIKLTAISNGELYDLYAPAVYGSILQQIPAAPVAEHILAKVFIKALQSREELTESLRSPLSNLLIDSRKVSAQTLLALRIFSECCGGSSVSLRETAPEADPPVKEG